MKNHDFTALINEGRTQVDFKNNTNKYAEIYDIINLDNGKRKTFQ